MKYLRLKIQEKNDEIKDVIVSVNYIEYIDDKYIIIYSMEEMDPIYLKLKKNDYNKFATLFMKNDCIQIDNYLGFVKPFINYEHQKKCLALDKEIEEKTDKFNAGKKITFII